MRILLIMLLSLTLVGCADDDIERPTAISVNAEGWIEAVPDTLTLTATARATGSDVAALQAEVDQITQAVVAAARKLKVDTDDIDTSQLSVQPEFEWQDRTRVYLGQSVQRDIVLTLREIERYGTLVQSLAGIELHQISAPRLGHSDIDALRLDAIDDALQRATGKAARVADSIGEELGEVLSVEVHGGGNSAPMMMAMEASPQRAPQIQFGKRRISMNVSMRFAID